MAIQSSTRERYQEFIKGLLLSLSKVEYREYSISTKIAKYKLFPALTKVLENMGYISRRKKGQKFEYIRLKDAKDVDPKHVIDIIKRCNSFYNKPKKVAKVIAQNNVLKAMQEIIAEARILGDSTVKVVYRNKSNHAQQYIDATAFAHAVIKQKIAPSDFEEHQIIHSPRSILIEKITGNGIINVATLNTARDFYEVLIMLNKEDSSNSFTKKANNLKQNAKRCPQTVAGNLRRAQLITELCQLYIDYKKIPGPRFTYMDIYNNLKQQLL